MELREFFSEDAVKLELEGTTKDEILKEMISLLKLDEKSEGMLFKMLKRRENLGSTGIGRSIAEHLLRSGYSVVGCSRRPADWEADGFKHVEVDASNEQQVVAMFREINHLFGRLDAAINSAAIASMNHCLLTPMSTLQQTLYNNVGSTFVISREAARLMRRRAFGRIVNFTSAAVPLHIPGEGAYLASKSAIESLSQVMASELAEVGITVNVVGPGPTETDMTRGLPKDKLDETIGRLCIKRMTTFDDINNVLDFLLSLQSGCITGQIIYLNGVSNR